MTIQLSYSDVLLTLLTLAVFLAALYLILTLRQFRTAAEEFKRTLTKTQELADRLTKLSGDAERTLTSLRHLSEEGVVIVQDVSAVSSKIRAVTEEGLEQISSLLAPLKYMTLLVTGLQAGFEALSNYRKNTQENTDTRKEETDEEGNV